MQTSTLSSLQMHPEWYRSSKGTSLRRTLCELQGRIQFLQFFCGWENVEVVHARSIALPKVRWLIEALEAATATRSERASLPPTLSR